MDSLEQKMALKKLKLQLQHSEAETRNQQNQMIKDKWKQVGKCVLLVRGVTNQFQRLEFARRQCQDQEDLMKSFLENRFEVQNKVMFDPSLFRRKKDSIFFSRDLEDAGRNRVGRTTAQVRSLRLTLRDCQSFGAYPDYVQTELSRQGLLERFGAGRVIIRQGHQAARVYFILGGTVVVTKVGDDEEEKDIVMLHKGDLFGDMELLQQKKRGATVTSAKDVTLWSIDGQDFMNAMTEHNTDVCDSAIQRCNSMTSSSAIQSFLTSLAWFEDIPTDKFLEDPKLATLVYYRNNNTIVRSSADNDMLYFVRGGKCDVLCKVTLEPGVRKNRDVFCFDTGMQYEDPGVRRVRPLTGVIRRDRRTPIKCRPMSAPAHVISNKKKGCPNPGSKRAKTASESTKTASSGKQRNISQRTGVSSSCSKNVSSDNTSFVKVCSLERGDVYGLTALFDAGELATCLVSRGCECIVINKDVFSLLLNRQTKQLLQEKLLFYPTYGELKKKLNNLNSWNKYKSDTCLKKERERWR